MSERREQPIYQPLPPEQPRGSKRFSVKGGLIGGYFRRLNPVNFLRSS